MVGCIDRLEDKFHRSNMAIRVCFLQIRKQLTTERLQ